MSEVESVSLKELLSAGVHFGHRKRYWDPRTAPFVYSLRQGVHIINLQKTLQALCRVREVVRQISERGGRILFVGTKRVASGPLRETALACGQHYVDKRWLGGTLTNWKVIRRSVKRFKEILKQKELGGFDLLSKKEMLSMDRDLKRQELRLGGLKDLNGLPDLLFIIDAKREYIAVQEAQKAGIPVVAVVDTNASPEGVTHPIPGNDDALAAVRLYLSVMREAILEGQELRRRQLTPVVSEEATAQ